MRTRFLAPAAIIALVLLSRTCGIEACGPDFEPDVFVRTTAPDDPSAFAKGQLGILQSGYDSDEYAAAYRYLTGATLDTAEQSVITSRAHGRTGDEDYSEASQQAYVAARAALPPNQWQKARAAFLPGSETANPVSFDQTDRYPDAAGNSVFTGDYLNCPDAAYANAVLTLNKRAAAWGNQSPHVVDWIRAQDAVFSNCAGKTASIPALAPNDAPALLRADRAYQLASAAFYAKQFDDAARQFASIAGDPGSPWRDWGAYLAARATVRKAFAMGKATDPYSGDIATYDTATMQRAQQMLASLRAQPDPKPSRAILETELNFIRIRTEPDRRAAEICAALTGPSSDPNFTNDLKDLGWLLQKNIQIANPPPLLAWIAAWRGKDTADSAFATWQQNHALPWLVVAMARAEPSSATAPALVDAAAKIPATSPAYDTVFFHRVRLLTAVDRTNEARALLDAALATPHGHAPSSFRNALFGERMAVAHSFNEALTFAPRDLLSSGSEGATNLQDQCNQNAHAVNASAPCPELEKSLQFDQDFVSVLNHHTPLATLIEAAASPSLPANLRQQITLIAWTRAVLLQDNAGAAKLAPMLPKSLREVAGAGTGFPADFAILHNSGIRPYLEPGVPRVASFSVFDELRDNWWCKPWDDRFDPTGQAAPPIPAPAFVSAQQEALASSEVKQLLALPDSAAVIGQRVVAYAKDHPDDPQVPEALALTVRAGHYACQTYDPATAAEGKSPYTPTSKAAFELLHRRYPKSPWAIKTRFYY